MPFQTARRATAVKVFRQNTTRSRAEVWRFWRKPGGLDLVLTVSETAIFAYSFFSGQNYTHLFVLPELNCPKGLNTKIQLHFLRGGWSGAVRG